MENRNEPADYRAVNNGFKQVEEDLLVKGLSLPESGVDSGIRYSKVSASGIKFSNFLDRSKAFQWIETGSGVAMGDYDGDGLVDVYLLGTDIPNKLYRNLGNFQFEDVTFEAKVDGTANGEKLWSSGASFADVDNDGDLDLFVCAMAGPNLLYINQGDGTFDEQTRIRKVDYIGASKVANFCDYDRDGDLDFYLVTYQDAPSRERNMVKEKDGKSYVPPEYREFVEALNGGQIKTGELDRLYENQGDGTFEEVSQKAGINGYGMGLGAIWLDYDNDGWQDIYVTNDFGKCDLLYRNNGDGTFTDVLPELARHTPWFSMGLDSGDINGDGLVDLITVDMSGTSHYKQKVDMGSMSDSAWLLGQGAPRQYMKNAVQINSGMGPFMESAHMMGLDSTDWTWSVRLVDMDNDGMLDVYVSNGHARDINSDVGLQFDAMKAEGKVNIPEWDALYSSVPPRKEKNLTFRNLGNLEFEEVSDDSGLGHVGVSHGAAFGDLDGDGDLDLVVNNYYEPTLVYRNDSKGGSRTLVDFRCRRNNFFGYGAKVELWQGGKKQVKTLSPTRGYISSDPPSLHFASASGDTIEKLKVTWPDLTTQVFENLQPNQHYRILESENAEPESSTGSEDTMFVEATDRLKIDFRHTENSFDDFQREPLLPYQLSRLGGRVAWGDVNGDKYPDLFCAGALGQAGQLYINEAGKSFRKADGPWSEDEKFEDMDVIFFDCDSDSDLDLLVTSGGNEREPGSVDYQDRLYRNDGNGNFENATDSLPKITESTRCAAVSDFDQDGDLDLFISSHAVPGKYPVAGKSYVLRNDNGTFVDVTGNMLGEYSSKGLVTNASWSDCDGDGWMDLVLAVEWGPITVLKNEGGKRLRDVTSEMGLSGFHGWWYDAVVADIDGDGDSDIVGCNLGLNTKYHADTKHPHRIYYADFDENGTMDLVESKFEGDVELPVRGKSCSTHCMPFLADKFETYHDFAVASLVDIYEPTIKERPFVEVNSFESAIFFNEGGKFRRVELPRHAQISPSYGAAVSDFNGDGINDVVMANNFHAAQLETGYMDGGLGWLMHGSNAGNEGGVSLECIWPNVSGIVVDAPAMEVEAIDFDLDGDVDLAFPINDGKIRIYENRIDSSPGR